MTEDVKRKANGRWEPGQSGNPAGAPRSVSRVRELLAPHKESLVKSVIAMALTGDVQALRLCLERLCPPLRADSEPVDLPGLAAATSLADKAMAILNALANGSVSPDAGSQILAALTSAAQLSELEHLKERLAALESRDLL
jgi:hypothetical protein